MRAMWAGVIACLLLAIAPCMCWAPVVISLPLAGYALYQGITARSSPLSPAAESCSMAGIVSGSVGTVLGLMGAALLAFYAIYFVALLGLGMAGTL